jgi:hypothetical protein
MQKMLDNSMPNTSAATNVLAAKEDLLESFFSTWSVPMLYNENQSRGMVATCSNVNMEAAEYPVLGVAT